MTGARISPLTQLFIIVTNVKRNLYLIWLNLTFIITLGFGAKNWLGKKANFFWVAPNGIYWCLFVIAESRIKGVTTEEQNGGKGARDRWKRWLGDKTTFKKVGGGKSWKQNR